MIKCKVWPFLLVAGFLILALWSAGRCCEPRGDRPAPARLRRPSALLADDEGRRLFTANRDSGTVSVIDVEAGRVISETAVGRRLAGLADLGDGRLLAVDEAAGEMIVLRRDKNSLAVTGRVRVGDDAVSVCRLARTRAAVACLWPQQLTIIDLSNPERPSLTKSIPLPFAPRKQFALPGGAKIVVADAFGGRLAVVDAERGIVESVRSVPGHNIRGLALSGDGKQLLLTQQTLAEDTPTRPDDIRWGNVISNGVRSLSLDDVLAPDADLLQHSHLQPLGVFGRGAGDPAGLIVVGGKTIVALSGTDEVAFGPELRDDWPRLRVGRQPTALVAAGRRIFVANTLGDSITIIDSKKIEKIGEISLGPTPEPTPAQRGELLFFDARLSVEGWMSCHSCHSDGHTIGLRSDTLGDGSYGAPKRVPSLLGVGDTAPWAWNGSIANLEDQVRQSIQKTMRGPRPTDRQIQDLTAYLRTLPPPPRRSASDGNAVRRGETAFRVRGCARCHAPPTYTTSRTYEVDLADEVGNRAFNPPSLRGVGHGVAFFHDGRAGNLEEILTRYRHQVPADMPGNEVADLLAFLRSL